MPGKAIIFTEGTLGIQAGSPFTPFHYPIIASGGLAPTLVNGRLAQLGDAEQSIIAPGVLAGANSFVLGEQVIDQVGGDRSVLIGYAISQNNGGAGQATDQILLGNTIAVDATSAGCTSLIVVGQRTTFTGFATARGYSRTIAIGPDVKIRCLNAAGGEAVNSVYIGSGVDGSGGGNVGIGVNVLQVDAEGVAVGNAALTTLQTVAIGSNADASKTKGNAIGKRARATTNANAFGWFCDALGDGSTSIGNSISNTGQGSVAIGNGVTLTNNATFLTGSTAYPIQTLAFGAGLGAATGGIVYTLRITDVFTGAGNNLQGNTLQVQCGPGTGNWPNTQNRGWDLQLGVLGASGNVQQVLTSVIAARHSDLNVALWGGLAATFGGGAKMLFIGNATTLPGSAPTGGGLMYATGGELHWVSSAGVDSALTPPAGGGTITGAGTSGQLAGFTGATAIGNGPATFSATDITPLGTNTTDLGKTALNFRTLFVRSISISGASLRIGTTSIASDVIFNPNSVDVCQVSDNTPALFPSVDNTADLGVAAVRRWKKLYLTGAAALSIDNSTTAAAAQVATFTNFPTGKAGNPTKFLNVLVDGANVVIPCW